jgi:hypothetical protein
MAIYANLTVADDLGRKTSRWVLLAAATLDDAKADYARLVTERADDRLRPLGLTPTLADYIVVYTKQLEVSGKRTATVVSDALLSGLSLHGRARKISETRQRGFGPVTLTRDPRRARTAFLTLNLLPFPGQRHSLVDVGTGRQRFVEGIRRARL